MEIRNLNISFTKAGSGSLSPRLSIPSVWVKEMGISPEDKAVTVSLYEDFILVKKEDATSNTTEIIESRNKNISFNKSGSGSVSCRLILPMTFVKHLDITSENRDVLVEFENSTIKIKKA